MSLKDLLTPVCCRLCFDKMNVLADITLGDPWGLHDVDRAQGESVAIIRTEIGRRVFQRAVDAGTLSVREIDYQQVLAGQGIERKRSDWLGYADAWDALGYPLPSFGEWVRRHAAPPQKSRRYRHHLQQAIALDHYQSREALVGSLQRRLFAKRLKKMIWRVRVTKSMIRRITRSLVRRIR